MIKMVLKIVKEKTMKLLPWTIIVLAAVITTGCAVSSNTVSPNNTAQPTTNLQQSLVADEDFDLLEEDIAEQAPEIQDPLEPLNRIMSGINDAIYFWLVKPCAEICKKTVPHPVRLGIRNFFGNISTPIRFVNCHLQGKTAAADTELNRFLINTTVGILGFGDPAKDQHNLQPPPAEDLGQSLATFGFENGCYLVLPFFGPSTLRDAVGKVGDLFLNPTNYVDPTETVIAISATKHANESSFHTGEYEDFKAAAVDSYIAMRQAYIQYRNKEIQE